MSYSNRVSTVTARHYVTAFMLLMATVILSACLPDESGYVFEAPFEGARYIGSNELPAEFRVSYKENTRPPIVLNGTNVAEYFDFAPRTATAPIESLKPFLKQGDNMVIINPGPMNSNLLLGRASIANFFLDSEGPEVIVREADFHGSHVTVHAELRDASEPVAVTVNGQAAVVEDGRFMVTVAQSDSYTIVSTDEHGFERTTRYASEGKKMEAMRMRMAGDILLEMKDVMEEEAQDLDLDINQSDYFIFNDLRGSSSAGIGCNTTPFKLAGDAWMMEMENIQFDSMEINDIRVVSGGLRISSEINGLRTRSQTHIRNCEHGCYISEGNARCHQYWSSHSYQTTRLNFSGASATGTVTLIIEDGKVTAGVADNFNVSLGTASAGDGNSNTATLAFFINAGNWLGMDGMIRNMIRSAMRNALELEMQERAFDFGFDLDTDIGTKLRVAADPVTMNLSNLQGGHFRADISSEVETINRDNGIATVLGSVITEPSLPLANLYQNGPYENMAMSVSVDAINQYWLGFYNSGMTHLTLDPVGAVHFGSEGGDKVEGDMRIRLVPAGPGELYTSSDSERNIAGVKYSGARLYFEERYADGPAAGRWPNEEDVNLILDVDIDVKADMHVEDNTFYITLGGTPDIEVHRIILEGDEVQENPFLSTLIDFVLQGGAQMLNEQQLPIELPELEGREMTTYSIDIRDGYIAFTQGMVF